MINDVLTVFLKVMGISTGVILLAYLYCVFGRWQEKRKYRKFDRETKSRIMKTIVKR